MTAWHDMTALALGREIEARAIDPRALARYFLDRAESETQYGTVYVRLSEARAFEEADAAHDRAGRGLRRSPLDGVPLSWKDLFDTAGIETNAGSKLLDGRVPDRDAVVLTRATRAGTVCLGKTTMTEFAFSGLGINPSYGTPRNPFDPETARIPGGSSSGAGVSVAAGLAPAALGTDTGGSVRIPAAWNGLVGLKTTAGLLPNDGVQPLSYLFDTVGPLTKDVADAGALFSILTETKLIDLSGGQTKDLSFAILANDTFTGLVDEAYQVPFDRALDTLQKGGVKTTPIKFKALDDFLTLVQTLPGPVAAECYAAWGALIEANPERCYEFVRNRILPGKDVNTADVTKFLLQLGEIQRGYLQEAAGFDGVLMPTMGLAPPPIEELETHEDAYLGANFRSLALTSIANQFGLCAITLPMGLSEAGDNHPPMPAGLTIMGAPFTERKLLRDAATLERVLSG